MYALEAREDQREFQVCTITIMTQNDTYDINDMGYNRRNNRIENEVEIQYNIYDPVGIIIEYAQ